MLDYATGMAMLAAPRVLGINDRRAKAVLMSAGAGVLGASALSDHELAVRRLIPMPVHLALDAVSGLSLLSLPWLARGKGIAKWLPHAAFGVGEVALAALTERRPRQDLVAPVAPVAPGYAEAVEALAPDPDQPREHRREDTLVVREENAAAAAAAKIGGVVSSETDDPAMDPVYQAGGGEQEGWEAAEEELIENASHDEGGGDPLRDAFSPELESDRSEAVYGEGDELSSTEAVDDPQTGEDDPGSGPGLSSERGAGVQPGPANAE